MDALLLLSVLIAQTVPVPEWDRLTVIGLLGLIVMSFLNEWVVTGKRLRADDEKHAKEREKDQAEISYWRNLALENLGLADKAVSLAEKQVRK